MSDYSYDYSVLVIAEPDFVPACNDSEAYLEKLTKFLTTRSSDSNLRRVTVTGRFNVPGVGISIDVDDRNKTAFVKSLDDHLNQFNEIVVITNFEKDAFLEALCTRVSETSKSLTIYGYETRSHEKS